MGLFSFLGGKLPEEIELVGDGYFKIEEFGAAKIEYEKALEKAQKKFPEKINLIQHLSEKIAQTQEALAASHLKNAELLIQSENFKDAEGLLQLALDLSSDKSLKDRAETLFKSMRKNHEIHFDPVQATGDTSLQQFNIGESHKNPDDYFAVLCSTLPEEIQEEYFGYGNAFKTGYVALNNGDFETAANHLGAAMKENPHPNSQIPVELATALIHMHQFEEASEILEQFIEKNPDSLRGYQALCEVYWDLEKFDHAVNLLQSCPEDNKSSLTVRMLLGETWYLSGRYSDAIRVFEKAFNDFGFNEIIARSLAKSHEALGDLQKARDLYGKVMIGCQSCGSRIDPFVKARYADLCFQTGDKSGKLLEIYFALVQEDPDNKYHYYQCIQKIYEDMGNTDQARRYRAMADSVLP
jgi:tetratricopeptide (TPR) repeat protein